MSWELRAFIARRILCRLAMWLVRLAMRFERRPNTRDRIFWLRLGQNCTWVGAYQSNNAFEEWRKSWVEVDGE